MARGRCRLNTLVITLPAARDIQSAARYIFKQGQNARLAEALIASIRATCEQIALNPLIGRAHSDYDLRSFPVKNYRVFYHVTDDVVEVVRVLHQRRNIEKALRRWRRKA